ncbi:MAG: Nif3-like dinuclear metal center hexameric protein [Rhodothermales bacterium]
MMTDTSSAARPTVAEIARALEVWAPPASAQSYDNVGLQVGDAAAHIEAALLALDLTPAVVQEAIAAGAGLIVTHHPLIFKPLRSVRRGDWHGDLILDLANAGIALYAIHTNLDAAHGGVSIALAERLGLRGVDFLRPLPDSLYKLVTFVPESHFEAVRLALAEAGAGAIGAYDACAFALSGTGYFRPGPDANPHIGTAGGGLEQVAERRLEVEVARWTLPAVVAALRAAHPYETVAYDVYPVLQPYSRTGMGAIGELESTLPLDAFLGRVRDRLDAGHLRFAGSRDASVRRVAVCGGSGSDLIGDALRAGADAYVTADITYHRFFDVLDGAGDPRMALIDAGHYETERHTEALLQQWLATRFSKVRWIRTGHGTSPMQSYP